MTGPARVLQPLEIWMHLPLGWPWDWWHSAGGSYLMEMSKSGLNLFRCLCICNPKFSKIVFSKNKNVLMVLVLWIYSFLLVLPTILELHGKFGYDHIHGKCGYLKREMDEKPDPRSLYFCIGFFNPLIIMLVSYYSIWRKTINSSSFIKLMWFVVLQSMGPGLKYIYLKN